METTQTAWGELCGRTDMKEGGEQFACSRGMGSFEYSRRECEYWTGRHEELLKNPELGHVIFGLNWYLSTSRRIV